MRNPVRLNNLSAHTFCKECIKSWFKIHKTNPLTNEKIPKGSKLYPDDALKREIDQMFIKCSGVMQHEIPPEIEKVAQEFYDENLKHLEGDFHWTPWAKEKWQYYRNRIFPTYHQRDQTQQSMNFIDELEKEIHQDISKRCQEARQEVQNADPNNPAIHQDIKKRLKKDVGIIRSILNALVWFFKTMWRAIRWPFKIIGDIISWLFRWNRNQDTNEENNDNESGLSSMLPYSSMQ